MFPTSVDNAAMSLVHSQNICRRVEQVLLPLRYTQGTLATRKNRVWTGCDVVEVVRCAAGMTWCRFARHGEVPADGAMVCPRGQYNAGFSSNCMIRGLSEYAAPLTSVISSFKMLSNQEKSLDKKGKPSLAVKNAQIDQLETFSQITTFTHGCKHN